jgi:hypothetical protein
MKGEGKKEMTASSMFRMAGLVLGGALATLVLVAADASGKEFVVDPVRSLRGDCNIGAEALAQACRVSITR